MTDKSSVALAVTSCFCLSSVISIGLWSYWDLIQRSSDSKRVLPCIPKTRGSQVLCITWWYTWYTPLEPGFGGEVLPPEIQQDFAERTKVFQIMQAIKHRANNGKQMATNNHHPWLHGLMQFWIRYVILLQTPFVVGTAPRALDFSILRTAVALCAQWDAMGHPVTPVGRYLYSKCQDPTVNIDQHQSTSNKSAQPATCQSEKEPLPLTLAVTNLLEHCHPLQFQP